MLSITIVSAQTGTLTGTALDTQHRPVPRARITVQHTTDRSTQSTKADTQGRYRFTLAPGSYSLRAEDDALEQATAGPITVTSGQATTVDLIVKPQYFDEPAFTVSGVTDNTYRGGHGAGSALRSTEALARQTAALSKPHAAEEAGNSLEAVHKLQAAAQSDPNEPNLFNLGTELLAHRAPEAAAQVFSNGVHRFPQSTRMLLGLGSAQYAAGWYEQAAQSFFRATDLNPADPHPYLFLTQCERNEITELPGYEERLARWAEKDPGDARASYYYGLTVWTNHHDAARSTKLLERALTLDPGLAEAHLQLGTIAAAFGDRETAINEFRQAIASKPEMEEAHYRLSEAYRAAGDHAGAAREIAIYKQLSTESAERLERERRQVQQFVVSLKDQ